MPDSSDKSQKLYERLAQLCFKHLPAKHTIKLVGLDFSPSVDLNKMQPIEPPPGLPKPLKEFMAEISEYPEYRLGVVRAK